MSLNGLDAAQVAEAYEAASEPGAWFVLKYAARDEVELLDQGAGGLPEIRKAIENYEETSPLYGFLRYRRRVVIIRFLPEGCSRLIQARVAVHFNAVCERFAPYDTTLEITEAEELRDTKLSAACSLHAASASNASSSSSNRRRRLNEIAEEDEEEHQQRAAKRQSLPAKNEGTEDGVPPAPTEPAVTLNSELATVPDESKFSAASTSDVPSFVGADPMADTEDDANRRMSTQSGRPELYNYAYPYSRPKVKLGPRPSLDVNNRPQTAGNFRPVSSIPAGLKLFGNKGAKRSASTKSRETDNGPTSPFRDSTFAASAGTSVSDEPSRATLEAARPATSSGIVPLPPKSPAMSTGTIKPGMTPEKARLMKAMKMRENKKKKAKEQPPVPALPDLQKVSSAEDAPSEEEPVATVTVEPENEKEAEPVVLLDPETEKRVTMIKADSGIGIDANPPAPTTNTDEASVLTTTDSRPTSPVVASSEAEQSTKASSISESTDETVEGKPGAVAEAVDETPQEGAVTNAEQLISHESKEDSESGTQETSVPAAIQAEHVERESVIVPESGISAGEALSTTTEKEQPSNEEELAEHRDVEEPESKESLPLEQDLGEAKEETLSVPGADSDDRPILSPRSLSSKFSSIKSEKHDEPLPDAATTVDLENNTAAVSESPSPAATPETGKPLGRQLSVSKRDLRKATKAAASPSVVSNGPESYIDEPVVIEEGTEDEAGDDHSEAETISASPKARRKFNVEPIRTDLPAADARPVSRTETDFADDESLMDELQSATVHEAKPMLVVQTPITPVFPGSAKSFTDAQAPSGAKQAGGVASARAQGHMVRTVSNPVRGSLVMPPSDVSQSSARSMSGGAAYLHKITQQQQAGANLAKKTNMGSGITQRIKALEMLSVEPRESVSAGGGGGGRERPSSTFFSVKKGRTPSRSPSVMERASTFGMKSDTPSTPVSRDVSPDAEKQLARRQRERSGSVASRLSMFESPHGASQSSLPQSQSPQTHSPRGRPESISVTAKIIRDPESSLEAPKDPSQFNHLELKQSPLVVDHQRASPSPASGPAEAMAALLGSKESIQERRISRESLRSQSHERGKGSTSRRSSLSVVKDFIKERRRSVTSSSNDTVATPTASGAKSPSTKPPSVHQTNSISQRLSFSSHRSSLSRDRDMGVTSPTPTDISGFEEDNDVKSVSSDKRRSRAGRLMRRLSNLGSRGKISMPAGLATTVTEEEIIPETPPPRPATTATSSAPAIVSYMGDVNVQFPDNLLWKRRNLCLDESGFILLSVAAQQQTSRAVGAVQGTKRYHLSDFRRPYAPDVEVQELPNSVVLDFMEGSGLQFACEDRAGQMNVLNILQQAHAKHALMFQL